jgi:hypothetical protein
MMDFSQAAADITNDLTLEHRFLPNPHLAPTPPKHFLGTLLVKDGLAGGEFDS